MPKLYIIPGFGESTEDPGYADIIKYASGKDYKVIKVNPKWSRNTMTKWVADFDKILDENPNEKPVILGFSFGAYITAILSVKHQFSKIILCSLSPYFSDDIQHLPKEAFNVLGKKRMDDLATFKFPENINTEAIFLVGNKDIPLVINRVKKSYDSWTGTKKLLVLDGVEHDIGHPDYIKAINALI